MVVLSAAILTKNGKSKLLVERIVLLSMTFILVLSAAGSAVRGDDAHPHRGAAHGLPQAHGQRQAAHVHRDRDRQVRMFECCATFCG